jgi:hypothetical protein
MWKIFSVPCGSALYKFHCIYSSMFSLCCCVHRITMGRQNVPGILEMHCNARRYGIAYFAVVGPLEAGNSEVRRVRWLGDVWLGAETTLPASYVAPLPVTPCPGGTDSRCSRQSV